MTRYVLILSEDRDVFEKLRTAVQNDHRFVTADGVVHCDGTEAALTNIYPIDAAEADWGNWATQTPLSDPQSMTTLLFECRSPEWIAEVGRLITSATAMPVWFVDAVDAVWPAGEVDPDGIVLD